MTILPLDVSTLTRKVAEMLTNDVDLIALNLIVERAEPVNTDSSRCPWVGIYKHNVVYPSRTLGVGRGYRQQKSGLLVIVQATHPESGEECEDALEALLQNILRVLLNNEGLDGLVDILDAIEITYSDYGKDGNVYMQQAILQFTGVVNVSANGG